LKRKILFFPTRFFPAISGAELYFQRLAEIFSSQYSLDVKILTSNAIDFRSLRSANGRIIEKTDKYYKSVNNLEIYRIAINYDLSLEEKLKKIQNLKEFRLLNINNDALRKFIKNGPFLENLDAFFTNNRFKNCEIIHATFYPYFNLILSLILAKQLDIPAICTPFFHFSNPRYLDPEMLIVLKAFDLIIACTEIEKKKLQNLLKINHNKIRVIPMGVDYDEFSYSKKNDLKFNFKKHYFQKKEIKYKMILFCGYKNFEKGAISILKAIPKIINSFKKVYFVFIGPSTLAFNRELSKVRKMTHTRIINLSPDNLSGYLDKKKISAFRNCDIYLMPSRSDAFGISFLEAWAAGKPVIGARIGATPEVIRDGIDGLLVRFNDTNDICKAVITLLKSKKLRNKLGSVGKDRVLRYYTWERIAKKTNEVYSEYKRN
jgi:glycosyltransferase involved in cell wall biosynthesis